MTGNSLSDDDIRRLLTAVGQERSLGHPARDELRASVLAEFRALVDDDERGDATGDDQPGHAVSGLEPMIDDGPEPTGDVTTLRPVPGVADVGRGPWWPRAALAAAASLVVLVATASWLQRSPDQSVETSTAEAPPLPGDDESVAVEPGRYSVAGIGGGIDLTLPDGVVVTAASPDLVELRPVDDRWGSSLVLMTTTDPLADRVDELIDRGLITAVRGVAAGADGIVTEFEIRPTNAARSDECRADPACLALGATDLLAEGVNLARQIDGPDGRALWTLYRSDTTYAPFVRQTNTLLASIEFSD